MLMILDVVKRFKLKNIYICMFILRKKLRTRQKSANQRQSGMAHHNLLTNSDRKTTKKGVTRSLIPWT